MAPQYEHLLSVNGKLEAKAAKVESRLREANVERARLKEEADTARREFRASPCSVAAAVFLGRKCLLVDCRLDRGIDQATRRPRCERRCARLVYRRPPRGAAC